MSTSYVHIVNPSVSIDSITDFTITKTDEKHCRIDCRDKPIILELGPGSRKASDGLFCFGVKQREPSMPPTVGLSVDLKVKVGLELKTVMDRLESMVKGAVGQDPSPALYYSNKPGYETSPTLNIRTKWARNASHIQTMFKYADTEEVILDPLRDLSGGFRGVYYVKVDGASQSKNGKWYVNLTLDSCLVARKKTFEPKSWKN